MKVPEGSENACTDINRTKVAEQVSGPVKCLAGQQDNGMPATTTTPTTNPSGNGVHSDDLSSSGGEDPESEVESICLLSNGTSHHGTTTELPTPNGEVNGDKSGKSKKKDKHPSGGSKVARNSEERNGVNSNNTATTSSDESEDVKDKGEDGDGDASKASADGHEDVFYVHDTGLTIKIMAPGAEPFEIQVAVRFKIYRFHSAPVCEEQWELIHLFCFIYTDRFPAAKLFKNCISCLWSERIRVIGLASPFNLTALPWTILQNLRAYLV